MKSSFSYAAAMATVAALCLTQGAKALDTRRASWAARIKIAPPASIRTH
jgi:hypothetical protein